MFKNFRAGYENSYCRVILGEPTYVGGGKPTVISA